jgi:hypothetical protein
VRLIIAARRVEWEVAWQEEPPKLERAAPVWVLGQLLRLVAELDAGDVEFDDETAARHREFVDGVDAIVAVDPIEDKVEAEQELRGERAVDRRIHGPAPLPRHRQFFLDPRRNPHIPPDTFTLAERLLGPVRYRREYLGDMSAPLTDVVFTGYTDAVNKLDYVPRSWRDVTPRISELYYDTPGADWCLGLDFDKRAGCTWSAARWYLRNAEDDLADAVMVIEHAQGQIMGEQRLPHALSEFERVSGYRTFYQDRCVLVADASGDWQNEERDVEQPPQWLHRSRE